MTDAPRKSVLDERLITVEGLAALLRVSTTTIYNRVGGWPHLRIVDGGTIRFRETQVEEIFELMTRRPVVVDEMARIRLRRQIGTMAQRRRYGAM